MIKQFTEKELQTIIESFVKELKRADQGEKTNFSYSIHELSDQNTLINSGQAIVIGGSNFQSCRITDNSLDLGSLVSEELPSMISKEILMDVILRNVDDDVNNVAVNFAFPLRPTLRNGLLDGKLIRGTKDHTLVGCVDHEIGKLIEDECSAIGKDVTVTVANDTICLILAGLEFSEEKYLAGGVVGTGFNFGFFKDNGTVVNIESGNFKSFEISDSGRIIDKESSNPSEQLYEKEVAGGYLHKHYNIIKQKNICNDSKDLSLLAQNGDDIAQALFRRSASLVAAEIVALYRFKNHKELNCVIEGSLFWKGWNYKDMVLYYCDQMGVGPDALKILSVDHSSLQGALHLL